jgi:hypothetical protein
MDISQFSKIAPYLMNPLVLIGFCLFLVYGVFWSLLKAKLLKPVRPDESSAIIRLFLKYAFGVAVATIALGFTYAGVKVYSDVKNAPNDGGTVTQQAGPCSSNVAGNGNTSSVNCGNRDVKLK